MLQYIIKSAVLLSALYIPYMLMLRKETFFRFNRMVLLSIMLLSLVLPFIDIHSWAWQSSPLQEPVQGFIEVGSPFILATGSGGSPVTHAVASNADTFTINWWWIATALYAIGMLATLLFKLAQMIILYKTIRRGVLWKYKTAEGVTIYCHTGNIAPFSWMRSIVISEEDFECNETAILSHEMGHIRHWHSLDILLANVCQIVQWANPLVWLMAGSLRDVHEYEADDTVLRSGINATQYQNLLIKKAVGSSSYAFANSFNHSLLKKRITMMLNKKSNPWMRTKALYLIPVAAVALSAFATPKFINSISSETDGATANGDKVTTIPVNTEIAEVKNLTEADVLVGEPDDEIFTVVEVNPTYKGGDAALMKLMMENLKYPQIAQKNGVTGRIMVQFVVEKDGTLSNYTVLEGTPAHIESTAIVVTSSDPNAGKDGYITQEQFTAAKKALEEDAIRILKLSSGNWNPGKQRGKAVRVQYTIPITYRLQ